MLGKAQTRLFIGFVCGFFIATTNILHDTAPNNKMSGNREWNNPEGGERGPM